MNFVQTEIFYQRIFEGLDVAVAFEDAEGKIMLVNEQLCWLTGYSKKEWMSSDGLNRIVSDGWRKEYNQFIDESLRDRESRFEGFFHRKNKTGFWALIHYLPLYDE